MHHSLTFKLRISAKYENCDETLIWIQLSQLISYSLILD